MKLCVIPARGGSKRIPRKNIKKFCGKPIIQYAIEVAFECKMFDKIIVSTDDEEIASVARSFGADVPFFRPAPLADDFTATIPVVSHAISEMDALGFKANVICCIYATAPFIRPADLIKAANILRNNNLDYVFSSTLYKHPIERAFTLNNERFVQPFMSNQESVRTQDFEQKYHDAGQYYWGARNAWLEGRKIFSPKSKAFVLPSYLVQDIDTPEDWESAELMWAGLQAKRPKN
jgi:pseudaminic acid cytidylyltransferase